MRLGAGLGLATRSALALLQGVMRLFTAGAVIYEAHRLFLRYYAREWAGIQLTGVNNCVGEDTIANGDLFEGKTFCNQPINFVPWLELYRRHWQAACLYYGAALVIIILIGLALSLAQRRLANSQPFGGTVRPPPTESEHLR